MTHCIQQTLENEHTQKPDEDEKRKKKMGKTPEKRNNFKRVP